jgi:hypothetical protein
MALMRTGRRGVNPGDDDKKKKKSNGTQSIQEVTVSSKKPVVKSTWEDVDKNEAAKKANLESASTYEKQLKYYNEQSKTGQKDMKTMFSGGGRYLNPDELKRWNSENSNNVAERAGLEAEKIYVPKGFKHGDATTNKGAIKTSDGQGYQGAGPVYHEFLKKPIKKQDIELKKINKDDLPIENLPILKAGTLPTKRGKIKSSIEKDKEPTEDWSIRKPSKFHGTSISYRAPSLNREKAVKGEIRKKTNFGVSKTKSTDVKFGGGVQTNSGRFGIKKLAYAAVANPLQKARFKSEVSQGKAYFGNYEGESNAKISEIKEDLKNTKKQMRSAISDVRKGIGEKSTLSKSERIKGYRDEIKDARSGIRTANKASKYLENLRGKGIHSYGTTVNEVNPGRGIGKIQYATPDKFQGYADFARAKKNKR